MGKACSTYDDDEKGVDTERKMLFGRSFRRWEDNLKMDFRECSGGFTRLRIGTGNKPLGFIKQEIV
jgi:hypothetical protein